MIEAIKTAVGMAWGLLFSAGVKTGDGANAVTTGQGVVVLFMGLLAKNPIFLLPMGFYLIIMGIKSTRKLVSGY